jgi:hypothetical protein
MRYEVKATGLRTMEDGEVKKVNDLYLVRAECIVDAHNKAVQSFAHMFENSDMEVTQVKLSPYDDIIADVVFNKFYKAKYICVTTNDNGKEKKMPVYVCVNASNIDDAKMMIDEYLAKSIADVYLESVSETKILDYAD